MIQDLTQGKPEQVLRRFTLPLFISVIFQQLYHMADSMIAGRFSANGEEALAAIGASYPITMIFMAVAVGFNIGCSVVISQLFGAKNYVRMKTAVSTTLIASLGLAGALTVLSFCISTPLLQMLQTPANIFADAQIYLNIYIGGFTFLFVYNACTGIFSSLGDSKTPLYFLIGSSLGNIILDLIFVAGLHLDVAGVAWATFIAQGLACVFVLATLARRLRKIECGAYPRFSAELLGHISRIALPSILQQSFISLGNILIQRLVNGFGSPVIAGYSAAIKLNTFAVTSLSTLGNGVSSFTAQNLGAGREDRVRRGFRGGAVMALLFSTAVSLLYISLARPLVGAFLDQKDSALAIETGATFLHIVAPFYFCPALKLIADGVLRGGKAMAQFMISTFSDLILRVVLAYVFAAFWGADGIWLSWPAGWIIAVLISVFYYEKGAWKKPAAEA